MSVFLWHDRSCSRRPSVAKGVHRGLPLVRDTADHTDVAGEALPPQASQLAVCVSTKLREQHGIPCLASLRHEGQEARSQDRRVQRYAALAPCVLQPSLVRRSEKRYGTPTFSFTSSTVPSYRPPRQYHERSHEDRTESDLTRGYVLLDGSWCPRGYSNGFADPLLRPFSGLVKAA